MHISINRISQKILNPNSDKSFKCRLLKTKSMLAAEMETYSSFANCVADGTIECETIGVHYIV